MGAPQPQGLLNRFFTGLSVPDNSILNITAPFLARAAIRLSFAGQSSTTIQTLTGIVQSPEPFQMATITAAILKTNGLAAIYEAQRATNVLIGDVTVTGDSLSLPPYTITNCAIENVRELSFDGTDPSYVVTITGAYLINQALFT